LRNERIKFCNCALKDAKNAPVKSDVRSAPVCTLDIQLPSYDRDAIEHDELRKRNTLQRGIQFTFLNGSGSLTQSGSNLLGGSQQQQPLEFNLRLLANDLNNSDRVPPFDWTNLAQRLDLNVDEIDAIRQSSGGASVFQQSPSNQTYDMLTYWQTKLQTHFSDYNQPDTSGEILLNALKDLNTDEEVIQRNISSSFVTGLSASPSGGGGGGGGGNQAAENILSVEKSLAKLNLNLNGTLFLYGFSFIE
jgi:hypothetical protein